MLFSSDSPWVTTSFPEWYWFVLGAGHSYDDGAFTLTLSEDATPGTVITLVATADVLDCAPGDEFRPCTGPSSVSMSVEVGE